MFLNCGVGEHSWVLWTARRSNQSILKEISAEYSLGGMMLKLKLQYFLPPDMKNWLIKRPWCWEKLMAGGEGDDRGWDGWIASLTRWTWVWVNSRSWWWTGRLGVLQFMGSQRVRHDWATGLSDWTGLNWTEWQLWYWAIREAQMKVTALARNRTHVNCLEGSYAHHYTTNAHSLGFPDSSVGK